MPRWAWNKAAPEAKRRYFELIRQGLSGSKASIADRLAKQWRPGQISRLLRRRRPHRTTWHLCAETIYAAAHRGLFGPIDRQMLRTGRTHRHKRGRGRNRDGALRQLTNMRSIHE